MSTKTEGDIPELFRQFSGNSANYQELTRAAAARASQARWPLLSAVELERGDIPAVADSLAGLANELAAIDAATDAARPARPVDAAGVDSANGVARAAAAEVPAFSELDADSFPPMPTPVVLPGNTIFMAPAPYTARHFAQLERTLAARREATLAEIGATSTQSMAKLTETADGAINARPVTATPEPVPQEERVVPTLTQVLAPAPALAPAPVQPARAPVVPTVPDQSTPGQPAAVRVTHQAVAVPTPSGNVKHAGLKPLFDRLAGEEEETASVGSLFSRLMQS